MSPAIPFKMHRTAAFDKVLSLPVVLCGLLVSMTFCFCCLRFNDPDTWWYLKAGQEIWHSHSIPRTDHWSFTVYGALLVPHEWLSQIFIYLAYAIGGHIGLQLWLCGVASAFVGVMYVLCYRYCGDATVAAVGGFLAFFFGTIGFAVRPQCIGYLLLGIELLLLERAWSGRPSILWWLPALFALWVNCHASYPVGFGILAAAGLCSYLKSPQAGTLPGVRLLVQVTVASVVALFLNPGGLRLLEEPFQTFVKERTSLDFIEEWLPLTVLDPRGIGMALVLAVILLAAVTKSAKISRFELLLLIPITFLALRHTRMVFVFGIIVAPIVCRIVSSLRTRTVPKPDHLPSNAFLLLIAGLCCYAVFPSPQKIQANISANNPVKAVQFIRAAGLTGPMMNTSRWGGYLVWALPEYKVFVDGRGDIFDWAGVLRRYFDWAMVQADPEGLLNEYRINFCLLQNSDPMAYVMPHLPGWRKVYVDEVAVIFVRNSLLPAGPQARVHQPGSHGFASSPYSQMEIFWGQRHQRGVVLPGPYHEN